MKESSVAAAVFLGVFEGMQDTSDAFLGLT
jgi:hypothetical protein